MTRLRTLWRRFLAFTRLDLNAVCELSRGLPPHADYHDYLDSDDGPLHFHVHRCTRCGKEFTI